MVGGIVCGFFLCAILNPIWMIRFYDVSIPRLRLDQVERKRERLREGQMCLTCSVLSQIYHFGGKLYQYTRCCFSGFVNQTKPVAKTA